MQNHIRTMHENALTFEYKKCGAREEMKNIFLEHIRTAHEHQRPFVRRSCDLQSVQILTSLHRRSVQLCYLHPGLGLGKVPHRQLHVHQNHRHAGHCRDTGYHHSLAASRVGIRWHRQQCKYIGSLPLLPLFSRSKLTHSFAFFCPCDPQHSIETLHNLLEVRSTSPPSNRTIRFKGGPRVQSRKWYIGYVMPDDMFVKALTVLQTLEFTAAIGLPIVTSQRQSAHYVNGLLYNFDLLSCQKTRMDEMFPKVISGGERKRLKIIRGCPPTAIYLCWLQGEWKTGTYRGIPRWMSKKYTDFNPRRLCCCPPAWKRQL